MKNQKEMNTVTYVFTDGTKQSQPIVKQSFFNDRGKLRTKDEMMRLFTDTASDRGAILFSVDSEEDVRIENVKEVHFTIKEKKNAKKDFKDVKRNNPEGYVKERHKMRNLFLDKLSKLRFNLRKKGLILTSNI